MLSEQLEKVKIVPVLVLNTLEEGLTVCEQLCKNGLPAAEITFRTAAAESIIREASKRFPEMYIGAGTVLNIADLHRAFDAGAKFAVAPGFNPKVVAEAVKCNLDFFPAVCTPSEVEQAMEFGCRMLKFFPAEACGGVPMLKSIIAPYKHLGVKFMRPAESNLPTSKRIFRSRKSPQSAEHGSTNVMTKPSARPS